MTMALQVVRLMLLAQHFGARVEDTEEATVALLV